METINCQDDADTKPGFKYSSVSAKIKDISIIVDINSV